VDHRWYLLTLAPLVLLVALSQVWAVWLQPRLTFAGNRQRFAAVVARAGGSRAVRRGFGLDFLFIAVFAATVPTVMAFDHNWWPVPAVTALLDVAENTLALRLLQDSASDSGYLALRALAVIKMAGYLLTLLVIICATTTWC